MVVRAPGDEAVAADMVVGRDPFHDVDWKRQAGDPGLPIALVAKIERGGRGVLDLRFGAEVVRRSEQQMRFASTHQIDVAKLPPRLAGQRR